VTRCRSAVCPWPENEKLPLLLNASYSPRGRIYGLPTYQPAGFVCEVGTIVGADSRHPPISQALFQLDFRPSEVQYQAQEMPISVTAVGAS
jgi:hypothetical protein